MSKTEYSVRWHECVVSFLFLSREDTHSSSAVPTQPTPMPVSSRSPPSSCCCWTVCGSCGVSSLWHWASLRLCSWGWPLRPTHLTMAPSCVTTIGRGPSESSWLTWNPTHVFKLISTSSPLFSLRCALGVMENTHCLFRALLRPQDRDYYSNPLYEYTELAIWPSVHPQTLQLWRGKIQLACCFMFASCC